MFHVINLLRRPDRLKDIQSKYSKISDGSDKDALVRFTDLNIIEAVDGTKELNIFNHTILNQKNDYDSNPRIAATIVSHYNAWKSIAESKEDFGVILEDDIFFNPDFKQHWSKIKLKLSLLKNREYIIYTGMGDFLPIHTKPPSRILLKAQEKSHIIKGSGILESFGTPNPNSAYIFEWFGAFSYSLSKKTAQKLITLAETQKIDKGLDVWLKETSIKKLVTVPLLTYHSPFDTNIYDSDTWGITKPMDNFDLSGNYKTMFLIPSRKNQLAYLKNTIELIMEYADYKDNVVFSIMLEFDDKESALFIKDFKNKYENTIYVVNTHMDNIEDHEKYNTLLKCGVNDVDFVAIWEYNKLISPNWDTHLFKYYESYDKPQLASFQIRSNLERNCDSLNSKTENNSNGLWNYSTPILTSKLLKVMNHVSVTPSIFEYLRYVTYISKINIFVRDIATTQIDANGGREDTELFYTSGCIKYKMNNVILEIKKNPNYKQCGLWIKLPEKWNETSTIGESLLTFGDRTF